jgi:hypothetical protein
VGNQSASLLEFAQNIADNYSLIPQVQAVVLAGSVAGESADHGSDIDLYVYSETQIPRYSRAGIATARSRHAAVGNQFWEDGDEWIEGDSGVAVDVTFRSVSWIEEQLDRVLVKHEASTGYSTCFWYNVLNSNVLFDRNGWFRQLQQWTQQTYPEPLRQAIVAKNHPILRDLLLSAYLHQLEKAVQRNDLISVNHRIAALLASYFDILFAVNRLPHPGEKRLLEIAEKRCEKLPAGMREQIESLLRAAGIGDQQIIGRANALVNGLDELLLSEGLIQT